MPVLFNFRETQFFTKILELLSNVGIEKPLFKDCNDYLEAKKYWNI